MNGMSYRVVAHILGLILALVLYGIVVALIPEKLEAATSYAGLTFMIGIIEGLILANWSKHD